MTQHKTKSGIPLRITDFLKDHFSKEIFTTVTTRKDGSGRKFYYVDVTQDNSLFHLRFDEKGTLLEKSDEPLQELYGEEEVTDVD